MARKLTKEDIRIFTERSGEFEFLGCDTSKGSIKVHLVDKSGYKYVVYRSNLIKYFKGERGDFEAINRTNPYSLENAKLLVSKSREYILLDIVHKKRVWFLLEDTLGYSYEVSKYHFDSHLEGTLKKFMPFHKDNPYTVSNITRFICNENLNVELLSRTYEGNGSTDNSKLDIKCLEHGEKFSITWNNFYSGKTGCGFCHSIKVSGENNVQWNPELTDEDRKRNSSRSSIDARYKTWASEVKSRDGYACSICKESPSGELRSHHIYSWDKYKELRYDLDNGVTLCSSHHKEFHNTFGYGSNTKAQYEEFLKRIEQANTEVSA